jgi:hypothetical protein
MEQVEATDLSVPIYLNQKIVFDVLAMLEDGFSQLNTLKTSASESETRKTGYGGSIGASNVFALLNVSLKGDRSKDKGAQQQTESTVEKVHTPTSLFFKLRSMLKDKSLIEKVEALEDVTSLRSGQFVEFRALLRKNPLFEYLDTFIQVLKFADFATAQSDQNRVSQGGRAAGRAKGKQSTGAKQPQSEHKRTLQQMEDFKEALTPQSDSLEVIGELLDAQPAKAVISTNLEFFNDGDASEIVDGEYRVLGKVVRVVDSGSDEAINLLRRTALGKFNSEMLEGQFNNSQETIKGSGMNLPDLATRIEGPAMQVIPVAIFV